jgi:hypothetical protein
MHLEIIVFPRQNTSPDALMKLGKALLQWDRPRTDGTSHQNFGEGIFALLQGRLPGPKPRSFCLNARTDPCVWILVNTVEAVDEQEIFTRLRQVLPQEGIQDLFVNGMSWRWLGLESQPPIPELVDVLKEKDAGLARDQAIGVLSRIGAEAVSSLIPLLSEGDLSIRLNVLSALGQIGRAATAAVPAIINTLDDHNQLVCCRALMTLGEIGPEAKAAVPVLLQLLKDEDQLVQ